MKSNGNVSFGAKLKGMSILEVGSGTEIGVVADLIIDPGAGKLLGIAFLRPDGKRRAIAMEDVHIGEDAVMMIGGTPWALESSWEFARGLLASKILGACIMTEDGKRIGDLEEVWVSPHLLQIYYRIARSNLQKFFRGGFYISGQLPKVFSPDLKRVIVPSDYKGYTKKSISDVTGTGQEVD